MGSSDENEVINRTMVNLLGFVLFGYKKTHWCWDYYWKIQHMMKEIILYCCQDAPQILVLQKWSKNSQKPNITISEENTKLCIN
jgi:hypothetical protein